MRKAHGSLQTGWIALASALVAGCALVSGVGQDPARTGVPAALGTPDRADRRAGEPRPAPTRPGPDVASWYGEWHHGRPTASGETYDMAALTAAHRSLPLGTCVEVVHLANGRRVHVRVNDRGPYIPGRTIDLSHRAAQALEMVETGLAAVRIRKAQPGACEPAETWP
jgi:rare lipoprotein A